jgi:hypothetical protein
MRSTTLWEKEHHPKARKIIHIIFAVGDAVEGHTM